MASIKTYIQESYDEMVHKVTWPSWKELQGSSVLVFIASLIIALLVWAMDYVFGVQNASNDESFWKGILGFIYELL